MCGLALDHMSFATHRCWETNLKVACAKTLSAWQEHFKGSLKALHEKASVSQSIGFLLPAQQNGRANELPAGWLMQRRPQNASQSANAAATVAVVEEETGEDLQFIYISPGGQRFTSLQQALQYAQNDKLRNRLNAEMQALQTESFDHNSNIHVQFTSNHEDYMHRGGHPIMQALPAYVYNMWVYGARKQSSQDPLGDYVISFDYDVDYKPSALVRTQRLSLIPKIPQLEGMQIPSPDVDPHKMSLIKLLLFKALGQSNDMDEKGNPLDPYRAIFLDAENAQKKLKRGEQENPYDVFPRAWKQYWQDTVLPKAADAQKKIEARMELPTLWECLEVFQLQKDLCQEKYLIPSDEDCERKLGCDARTKLQNRLTLQEYVCYLTKKLVKNLDAYGRAKAAPKTKSYALDADAKEDPGLQREAVGTAGAGEESFEPAFEDALDPDIDGEVRLKASDAPLKVHHPLTASQRLQAMIFHRQKHTKFVRDMISASLFPLTADEETLHRTVEEQQKSGSASVNPREEQMRLKEKTPMITQTLLDAQRAAMTKDGMGLNCLSAGRAATGSGGDHAMEQAADSDAKSPEAEWRTLSRPSEAMARKVAAFEKSSTGFKLAPEQLSACRWFAEAMDVALEEEENQKPLRNRTQHACLLIGAGGTGKTTIILELMLDVFCHFFPARPGEEERYMISTFSHSQSDAISNDVYRARTCHTACSYRVASLRNKHLALKTKEQEMKQRWVPKILLIQDEISLVPAAVENMMLYRSMRARQDEGLDPGSYFHAGELMGRIPILLIAGDFLQIKPANEISLADNLEELVRKRPDKVQTEHYAAQAALMSIETVIHLKKSKRFQDVHLPEITTAMRTCTPAAPLSEDHLQQLRMRKIENCKKELETDFFKNGHVVGMYWENIARSMVERAHRDAQQLDVPLFCLQAADQRHARKNKTIDKQLTHQLLTVPNPHRTGKLQGMLLVHENMIVRLSDVLAPHLGLVKDKMAMVVKVDLHHEDEERLRHREAGFCHFVPEYMAKGIWVKLLKRKVFAHGRCSVGDMGRTI